MASVEKKIEKWRKVAPKEVRVDEIVTVLDVYFRGNYKRKSGSHIVIHDSRLADFPDRYGPHGEVTIPVKSGQKVKGFYVKRLLTALDDLGFANRGGLGDEE